MRICYSQFATSVLSTFKLLELRGLAYRVGLETGGGWVVVILTPHNAGLVEQAHIVLYAQGLEDNVQFESSNYIVNDPTGNGPSATTPHSWENNARSDSFRLLMNFDIPS
jgi:hypothetical protein